MLVTEPEATEQIITGRADMGATTTGDMATQAMATIMVTVTTMATAEAMVITMATAKAMVTTTYTTVDTTIKATTLTEAIKVSQSNSV